MSKLTVEQVDSFPPLVRGGAARNSEEREQIQSLLVNKAGINQRIKVKDKKEYNSLQQRIRGIAKTMGVSVSIQWSEKESALYFRSEKPEVEQKSSNGEKSTTKK